VLDDAVLDDAVLDNAVLDARVTSTTLGPRPDRWNYGGVTVAPVELDEPVTGSVVLPDTPWITIVWNDPINLMDYVAYVFKAYFGYPEDKAKRLMLAVHQEGRAVVSNGSRDEMERDVQAMHGYGLWATLKQDN
jgi:ATP-dependent Clp protease adaptor protein ClpS